MNEEEYELIPLSPLRKMEKRLERLERSGTSTEMIRELIEVVKTNQKIVDDVVRINSDMIKNVSSLSETVNKMTNKIYEFMSRIEIIGETEKEEKGGLEERIAQMEKRINSLLTAANRRMQRPVVTRPVRARVPARARPVSARRMPVV